MNRGTRIVLSFLVSLLVGAQAASAAPYDQVRDLLHQIAQQPGERAKVFTLGVTDSGQAVEGLAIGNGPIHNLVVATHHGNEYGSTEVAKAFAAALAQNPIAGQTIYVIPVLNITGYNADRREETLGGLTRDPNRDYPGPCGTQGPHKLKSTALLAKFVADNDIVASATLHTFSPAVLYPWGISTRDLSTPYDAIFKSLGEAAAVESGYAVGNSTELLYPADGTFEDYSFWKHGIWSMLFEMGYSHDPSPAEVKKMIEVNVPGLRRMFEKAPTARAVDHDFHGKCDAKMFRMDRHDE